MKYLLLIFIIVLSFACQKNEIRKNGYSFDETGYGWEIDQAEIVGRLNDNFPLVNQPIFVSIKEANTLQNGDKVFAVNFNGTVKVFPLNYIHNIEIVNDYIDDLFYAITLCPKTMSALAWNRIIGKDTAEFRASGMLFKDNLLPLDTKTGDIWSQMLTMCVSGGNSGYIAQNITLIETKWSIIKNYYKQAQVFKSYYCNDLCDTIHTTNTLKNDIGTGNDDSDENPDIDIFKGDRVFGIPGFNRLTIYPNELFNDSVHVYNYQSQIIVGNNSIEYIQAFNKKPGLKFYAVQNSLPVIMVDNEGNSWDIFGNAVSGSRQGESLGSPNSYRAYFWAWKDMFYKISVFDN